MEGLGEGKAAVAGLTLRNRCEVVKSALSPPPVLPLPHLIIPLLFLLLCRFPYRLFLHSQSFQPFITGALLPLLLFVFTFFFFISVYSPSSIAPHFTTSPCVGWPMSRPLSLALVWHASHNGQIGEYHTLPVSLHLLLLLYSAHPLPCQDVTLLPNGENQSHVSSLKAVCIDIASRFFV